MRKTSLLVVAAIVAVPSVGLANLIVPLPAFNAATPFTAAFALSADGNTGVGYSRFTGGGGSTRPFKWSPGDAALTNIGTLSAKTGNPPGDNSYANGVSANGAVIVGASPVGTDGGSSQSSFKFSGGSISNLGQVFTGLTEVAGVSDDGSTMIASASAGGVFVDGYVRPTGSGAFLKLSTLGAASGPVPANTDQVTAEGISADGKVITGRFTNNTAQTTQAFRWTTATGFVTVGATYPSVGSAVPYPHSAFNRTPVSGDGNWIADIGINPATSAIGAYRYDVSTGTTTWRNASAAYANGNLNPMDITNDGNYIVGRGIDGFNGWIWSPSTGFENISQFLSENGLSLPGRTNAAVYGITEVGNQLDLIGSGGFLTSYYAQVTVPEPGVAMLGALLLPATLWRRAKR